MATAQGRPAELLCAAAFLILLLLGHASGQPPPPQRLTSGPDLNALFSLRASLGIRSRDWPRKVNPCSNWTGVICDAGRVTELNLSNLHRTRVGRQSPSFAVDGLRNLTTLRSFNSSGFLLQGSIPDWFGAGVLPPTLAVLDLSRSSVSGAIPASIGGLPAGLQVLSLGGNSLAGSIPSSLGQLQLLRVLDLSTNRLSGSIPDSFGSLANLTSLDLSGNFLGGQLPSEIGSLRGLKTLALSNNMLSGPIPPSLANLSALATLDLHLNPLTGEIPPDLFTSMRSLENLLLNNCSFSGNLSGDLFTSLPSLRVLALRSNNFSGELPDSLWALPSLRSLDLSDNSLTGTLTTAMESANFTGAVIDLSHNLFYGDLPNGAAELATRATSIDISFNYFEGRAPAPIGGDAFNASIGFNCFRNATTVQRSPEDCAKFYDERGLKYDGMDSPNATESSNSSSNKSRRRLVYILIAVFGGLTLFVVIGVLVFVICLRKRLVVAAENQGTTASNRRAGAPVAARNGPRVRSVNLSTAGDAFSYDQLLRATSDFSETNIIKHGHSGELYYGVLESGLPVVVKRVDMTVHKPEEYMAELDLFSHASHTRLVPFLGHCMEHEKEKLLVYKYMPNRDLASSLHKKSGGGEDDSIKSLDWITRLKIAIGVAEALCYLHHEHVPGIIHRDIQASSILLDDKFEVRLGSLSEACIQDDTRQNLITRFLRPSGSSRRTSEPSTSGPPSTTCSYDVYCLGRVLLELVTGNVGIGVGNDQDSREWLEQTLKYISSSDKELLAKIVDPSLIVDEDLLEEVWSMAIVAKSCLNLKPSRRPHMRNILRALENPLRVIREEANANSLRLGAASSRGSWNAAIFGSWRSSSETASVSGQPNGHRRSGGDQSFNRRRPSNEIFPETTIEHDMEA